MVKEVIFFKIDPAFAKILFILKIENISGFTESS